MLDINIRHLNLKQIAESGQCFRWKRQDDADGHMTYLIPSFGPGQREFEALTITALSDMEFRLSCDRSEWDKHWSGYFDMDTDYDGVEKRIDSFGDNHAKEAYALGSGIRILKQDLWEMIITFLISQNNNITRITRSVEEICNRHGGYMPRPDEFDRSILSDKSVGLGYRAPYIDNAVKEFADDQKMLEKLTHMSYEESYETLLSFTGIGPKVANCICLFGLHHIEAFPIDTHVKQLLAKYYPQGFPYEYYEGIAGIVQQYLFYYELCMR